MWNPKAVISEDTYGLLVRTGIAMQDAAVFYLDLFNEEAIQVRFTQKLFYWMEKKYKEDVLIIT